LISQGKGQVALKASDGRWLVPDARDGRTPRLTTAWSEPSDGETFALVPAGENRFAFQSHASGRLLVLDPAAGRPAEAAASDGPSGAETIEVYYTHQLPTVLETAIPAAINRLAEEELADKQYDKSFRHITEKYIKLPDPTLKNPLRLKRHRVYAVVEESRVQAQLDGETDIRLPALLLLTGPNKSKQGLIFLAVDARLPVRGLVQYKILNVGSGSTKYYTTIQLSAVAEIRVRQSGGDVTLSPPVVKNVHVSLSGLKLSNDLLHSARGPIERTINGELRRNNERICQEADKALKKAISSRDVRIPMLGYLKLL